MEVGVNKEYDTLLTRQVDPKGRLLNDTDSGIDNLGYSVYAEALSTLLHRVQTPLTVGIFAPWGSGKSFLLREVKYLLRKYQRQSEVDSGQDRDFIDLKKHRRSIIDPSASARHKRSLLCAAWTLVFVAVIACLAVAMVIVFSPEAQDSINEMVSNGNQTSTVKLPGTTGADPTPTVPNHAGFHIGLFAVLFLLGCTVMVFLTFLVCVLSSSVRWWNGNFSLVLYSAFTRMPTLSEKVKAPTTDTNEIIIDFDEDAELSLLDGPGPIDLASGVPGLDTKYVFVNFRAWEYVGSDTLWAGIVTNLTEAIEAEFGIVTARLFRMLNIQEFCDDTKRRENCIVYVATKPQVTSSRVRELMTQYGVVLECRKVEGGWHVRYSNSREAKTALKALKILGSRAKIVDCDVTEEKSDCDVTYKSCESNNNKTGVEMKSLLEIGEPCDEMRSGRHRRKRRSFCRHFSEHPRRVCCGCPYLYLWLLLVVAIVLFPVGITVLVNQLHLEVIRTPRYVPEGVQIIAWMPAALASTVVIIRFGYAMFQSQTRRVKRALVGAKGNMANELGFMHKVQKEVQIIEKLIRCVRYTKQTNYKIVISIDDLDRCPQHKVKSVLESVSILLSGRSSPFICLVALDSRVAVKCIEQEMSESLLKANVNGHEYLKKIINLPFCLPELGSRDKRRYIAGLLDSSDRVKLTKVVQGGFGHNRVTPASVAAVVSNDDVTTTSSGSEDSDRVKRKMSKSHRKVGTYVQHGPSVAGSDVINFNDAIKIIEQGAAVTGSDVIDSVPLAQPQLSEKEFLFECRRILHDDVTLAYHLSGNPRNMKRIFNVVSMTSQLMTTMEDHQKRAEEFNHVIVRSQSEGVFKKTNYSHKSWIPRTARGALDLVTWVVLTDQWPYRTSYVMQIIDDADQRSKSGRRNENINDDVTLKEIYEKIALPEIEASLGDGEETLLSLDGDPDLFYSFLTHYVIRKKRAKQLCPVSINLDQSLRQNIALCRALADIRKIENERKKSKV